MLEVFEDLKKIKNKDEQLKVLTAACNKYPLLPKLLKIYIVDEDRIFTPMKIMKMMNYYRVEKGNDINKLGEIGDFAASRVELLKRREFGWKRDSNHLKLEMKDVKFLIDRYEKLKIDVSHKNQYKILKSCFLLLKPIDVKWFVRLLCRKVEVKNNVFAEVIKNAKV